MDGITAVGGIQECFGVGGGIRQQYRKIHRHHANMSGVIGAVFGDSQNSGSHLILSDAVGGIPHGQHQSGGAVSHKKRVGFGGEEQPGAGIEIAVRQLEIAHHPGIVPGVDCDKTADHPGGARPAQQGVGGMGELGGEGGGIKGRKGGGVRGKGGLRGPAAAGGGFRGRGGGGRRDR